MTFYSLNDAKILFSSLLKVIFCTNSQKKHKGEQLVQNSEKALNYASEQGYSMEKTKKTYIFIKKKSKTFWWFKKKLYLCIAIEKQMHS